MAIAVAEMDNFDSAELSALIMAMHKMQQRQLSLVLIGAGLPILPGLAGKSKSYAERLFNSRSDFTDHPAGRVGGDRCRGQAPS